MADIYGKLVKEWGGFQIGDVVRFGASKFEHLKAAGIVEKTNKQRAVNDPSEPKKEPPKVETTMAELKVEKAVVTPEIKPKEAVEQPKRRGRPRINKEK